MTNKPASRYLLVFIKWVGILVLMVTVLLVVRIYFMEYGYRQPFYKMGYLTRKAERGDVNAARKLSLHYEGKKDMDSALYWLRKGAAFGDKEAQRQLYHWLEKSEDEKSRIEGLNSLLKAAENGEGLAQLELSNLYFEGRGVDKSVVEGERWLRRSAVSQFPPAMTGLSTFILAKGWDRKSLAEAYAWARLALERVNPKSVIATDARRQIEIIRKGAQGLGMSDAELEAEAKEVEQQFQPAGVRTQ